MALFGRNSITASDAAKKFIEDVLPGCVQAWPEICDALSVTDRHFQKLKQDKGAAFEFSLAVISFEMRALRNLLASDQAERIERHIFSYLSSPPNDIVISPLLEDGTPKMTIDKFGFFAKEERRPEDDTKDYPEQSILLYQRVFGDAIKEGDMFTAGPAALLGMRLGLNTDHQSQHFMTIRLLSGYLAAAGAGWWKDCLKQYRVGT